MLVPRRKRAAELMAENAELLRCHRAYLDEWVKQRDGLAGETVMPRESGASSNPCGNGRARPGGWAYWIARMRGR